MSGAAAFRSPKIPTFNGFRFLASRKNVFGHLSANMRMTAMASVLMFNRPDLPFMKLSMDGDARVAGSPDGTKWNTATGWLPLHDALADEFTISSGPQLDHYLQTLGN